MTKEEPLEHQTRKYIYNYISKHPGATFGTIQGVFDLVEGTLRYHLNFLERHGQLRSESKGRTRCYYVKDLISAPVSAPESEGMSDAQARLIEAIKDIEGMTIGELVEKTELNRPVVQENLAMLREQMKVWKIGNGRNSQYILMTDDRLRVELFKILVRKLAKGEIDEGTYMELKSEIENEKLDN